MKTSLDPMLLLPPNLCTPVHSVVLCPVSSGFHKSKSLLYNARVWLSKFVVVVVLLIVTVGVLRQC